MSLLRRQALVVVLTAAFATTFLAPQVAVSGAPSQPNISLPAVSTGVRPGPPVLYEPLARPPELAVQPPFAADPLMVSGTDAYCPGEYLYQDYLFDDHGANSTVSLPKGDEFGLFPPAGDVKYPTNDARYARNAADIVEFRMHAGVNEIVFRITFNTVIAANAPVVGIGIDTDRAGALPVPWPNGAGITTPGLDAFITAWGSGGQVATRQPLGPGFRPGTALPAGAVALNTTTNQLTIRVDRSLLAPGNAWRVVAGAGLWDGAHGFLPVAAGTNATASQPASGSGSPAPAIFNLAFRFDEKQGGDYDGNTVIGYGNWFDETQGLALRDGTSGTAYADVSFAELARGGPCRAIHGPGRAQARVFASHLDVPEGLHSTQPSFGGRLQPYMLHLPPPSSKPPGLTLALHGNSATFTQWHTISPRYLQQIGDERNQVVLSPLGRSTSGSGIVYDWFEAWADAAHRVRLDPSRTTMSGYSAGGYNTFVNATMFPDLFGGAFAIVGAGRLLDGGLSGGYTNFDPNLGNLRWMPVVAWNQVVDELAPYIGIRGTANELNRLGLRNNLYSFPVGEHFTPGLLDEWAGAAAYLGDASVTRDPSRVDYTIAPETWTMLAPDFGPDTRFPTAHVVADHAYWVSDLRTRGPVRDSTNTIRGSISAISRAFGQSDPTPSRVTSLYPGPPLPATIDGTEWGAIPSVAPRNALEVRLRNIGTATIDGARAKLSGDTPLTVTVTSDGDARLRIDLPTPGTAAGDVVLAVKSGTSTFVLPPPAAPVDAAARLPATGGDVPVSFGLVLAAMAVVISRRLRTSS